LIVSFSCSVHLHYNVYKAKARRVSMNGYRFRFEFHRRAIFAEGTLTSFGWAGYARDQIPWRPAGHPHLPSQQVRHPGLPGQRLLLQVSLGLVAFTWAPVLGQVRWFDSLVGCINFHDATVHGLYELLHFSSSELLYIPQPRIAQPHNTTSVNTASHCTALHKTSLHNTVSHNTASYM
jgi:hypothetical protein